MVQGHADIEAEIEKAKKKLDKVNEYIQRQEKVISGKDYQTKVKDSVKELDASKLADTKAEADTIAQLIQKLDKLKAQSTIDVHVLVIGIIYTIKSKLIESSFSTFLSCLLLCPTRPECLHLKRRFDISQNTNVKCSIEMQTEDWRLNPTSS